MRLLGVDFGFKRIGVAVVDESHPFPRPKNPIGASGSLKMDALKICEVAAGEEADAVVLGLPLEPDGTTGRMARIAHQLKGRIEDQGRTVHLVDERLTSVEAEQALHDEGMKASLRDRHRDAEAACRILDRYLTLIIHGNSPPESVKPPIESEQRSRQHLGLSHPERET